ncbi:MAG: kinase [Lachnospiraceae bacterium]|jgi:hypothetical protein|nr:kinase [Lachnospiraceae bacterium]
MRLQKIQNQLNNMGIKYSYSEEDDCGSIDFEHKGLRYNIWEFPAPERGAESNIRSTGRQEEFGASYEEELLDILKSWR